MKQNRIEVVTRPGEFSAGFEGGFAVVVGAAAASASTWWVEAG